MNLCLFHSNSLIITQVVAFMGILFSLLR